MLKDEKQQIAARLKDYCAQKGSQNKAANSMTGREQRDGKQGACR